jgi:hypothetical protein
MNPFQNYKNPEKKGKMENSKTFYIDFFWYIYDVRSFTDNRIL